nr:uncharacterized protein LOC109150158 isoform X1 [Ipomoea batatas]
MANKDLRRQLMGGEVDESTHLHLGSDGVKQNRARQPAAATHVAKWKSRVTGARQDIAGGGEEFEDTKDVVVSSSPGRADHQENEEGGGGFNLWQWSLSGIGAICSFGVAAATTICIVFIENQQKHKRHHQNHNIRFQIYTHHDKRIKEVVEHASKLKEAISTARGVPFTRAHITFGGYCDAF